MMIIFFFVSAVIIYSVLGNGNKQVFNKNNAESILKERYAKGEIDEETFIRMQETLKL